jgi:O-antigen ligase
MNAHIPQRADQRWPAYRRATARKRREQVQEAHPLLHIAAVLISAMLGVTVTDRFGFERSALIEPTNLLRLSTISTMGLVLVWYKLKRQIKVFDGPCKILVLFYAYQFVTVVLTWHEYNIASHLKQFFSIMEWVIIVFTSSAILNFYGPKGLRDSCLIMRRFIELTSIYTILFMLLIGVYNPHIIYFDSLKTSLGGYAIHPNKLSILCALGILAWLDDRESRFALLIAVLLALVAILTGSRSGIGACLLALGYGLIGRLPPRFKLFLYIILVPGFAFMVIALLGEGGAMASSLFSSSLTNLNGRGLIWDATVRMYQQRPMFGWGWLEGPARLGTYVQASWFAARNAQNDFLNVQIASGLFATIFLALIYLRDFITGVATEMKPTSRLVLGATVVIFLSALVEPILSTRATSVGMIFIIVSLAAGRRPLLSVAARAQPRRRREPFVAGRAAR